MEVVVGLRLPGGAGGMRRVFVLEHVLRFIIVVVVIFWSPVVIADRGVQWRWRVTEQQRARVLVRGVFVEPRGGVLALFALIVVRSRRVERGQRVISGARVLLVVTGQLVRGGGPVRKWRGGAPAGVL